MDDGTPAGREDGGDASRFGDLPPKARATVVTGLALGVAALLRVAGSGGSVPFALACFVGMLLLLLVAYVAWVVCVVRWSSYRDEGATVTGVLRARAVAAAPCFASGLAGLDLSWNGGALGGTFVVGEDQLVWRAGRWSARHGWPDLVVDRSDVVAVDIEPRWGVAGPGRLTVTLVDGSRWTVEVAAYRALLDRLASWPLVVHDGRSRR